LFHLALRHAMMSRTVMAQYTRQLLMLNLSNALMLCKQLQLQQSRF
jgi:hypothetical protein